VEKVIRDIVLKLLIQKIIQAVPWLGLSVINPVFVFFFSKIFDLIYDEMVVIGTFIKIEVKTQIEVDKYNKATIELKKAIDSQDKEQINHAKDNYKKYLSDLISYRN